MPSPTDTIKLNNGVEVPIIAQGSYAPPDPESQGKVKDWTLLAIKNGYRHIDTAWAYGTEKAVGQAIKESGIPREEFFITTKLAWNQHGHVKQAFEESLANLDCGYIDLYLMHWPQFIFYDPNNVVPRNEDGSIKTVDTVNFNQSWAEMEKLLDTGKVRALGVSNFSVKNLEKLFTTAKIVPTVNQIELHPYLAQNGLRDYCTRKGIVLAAYTPSGYSVVRNDPLVNELAKKYNVTPTQVIMAWHWSRKNIIIAKSENSERQKENLTIPDISEVDIAKIWDLDRGQRICNKADEKHGQVWGWTYEQLGWEDYHAKN
ncbi:Aldo/keto reductase [Agrocybe pediades]|nr:Aldo/keto reductase [Agrocybe pediades]